MKIELIIMTIGATASVLSMLFTASIALKCNGKLVRAIERNLRLKISED